jgi:hypothetical protein
MRSDLAEVAWMVRDHTQIDCENRELQKDIVARDEVVAAVVRDKSRYHIDLEAVAKEEVARAEALEEYARVAAEEELAASPRKNYIKINCSNFWCSPSATRTLLLVIISYMHLILASSHHPSP